MVAKHMRYNNNNNNNIAYTVRRVGTFDSSTVFVILAIA